MRQVAFRTTVSRRCMLHALRRGVHAISCEMQAGRCEVSVARAEADLLFQRSACPCFKLVDDLSLELLYSRLRWIDRTLPDPDPLNIRLPVHRATLT